MYEKGAMGSEEKNMSSIWKKTCKRNFVFDFWLVPSGSPGIVFGCELGALKKSMTLIGKKIILISVVEKEQKFGEIIKKNFSIRDNFDRLILILLSLLSSHILWALLKESSFIELY